MSRLQQIGYLGIYWMGLLAYLIFPVVLHAAPITFNSAMPVTDNDVVYRLKTTTLRASVERWSLNRNLRVQSLALVGAYGLNPDVALIGVVPYLDKEQTRSSWSSPRRAVGFGDVRGVVRYTAYRNNYHRGQTAVAPFVGLEMPNGEHDKDGLPRPLQLGSGSWDPSIGVVYQKAGFYVSQFASLSYQDNTEADGFEFGDVFEVNYAYQRVLKAYRSGRSYSQLTGLVEINLEDQEKHEKNGVPNPNTGGTSLYLSPGLQYVRSRRVLEVSVQLPLEQNRHGTALERDFLITVGGRWNF
ncbi:MAG: transporter [bacterium]